MCPEEKKQNKKNIFFKGSLSTKIFFQGLLQGVGRGATCMQAYEERNEISGMYTSPHLAGGCVVAVASSAEYLEMYTSRISGDVSHLLTWLGSP
jgi:hypothetical protein